MAIQGLEKFKNEIASHKRVGLDTMCFIYQFADQPEFSPFTNILFEQVEHGRILAVTSTITVVEVFIRPEKLKNVEVILAYESFFQNFPNLEIVNINWHVARLAAKLRGVYLNLRTPDALQLSAALLSQCSAFITNDTRLKRVKELKVLALSDYR